MKAQNVFNNIVAVSIGRDAGTGVGAKGARLQTFPRINCIFRSMGKVKLFNRK